MVLKINNDTGGYTRLKQKVLLVLFIVYHSRLSKLFDFKLERPPLLNKRILHQVEMRRAKLRNEEPIETKYKASSNVRSKVMSQIGKIARPRFGLFVGLCICVFMSVLIFSLSSYFEEKISVREKLAGKQYNERELAENLSKNRMENKNGIHDNSIQDAGERHAEQPIIKRGRFKDKKRDNGTSKHETKDFVPTSESYMVKEGNNVESMEEVLVRKDETMMRKSKETGDNDGMNKNEDYYVLLQLVNAYKQSKFARNFKNCITSILQRTKLELKFLLTVDDLSKKTAEEIFQNVADDLKLKRIPSRTYFLIDELNEKVFPYTKALQERFSSGQGAYYSHAIFFIAPVMHKVLPSFIKRLVMLDTDLQFRSDIKMLFDLFENMSSNNIMALATDQQPVYRHVLWSYRQKNPGTKVGEPPPYGKTGFNSGVKLVNLHEMRNNRVYNELLQSENISKIASKYEFKGHLGDQDFYSLISFDYSDMFYTLPCQWNRQLCTWWKNNGYQDVFDLYFKCSPPFHVLHGNCNTPIPED